MCEVTNRKAVHALWSYVQSSTYSGKDPEPIGFKSLALWVGAGFSKSWNSDFPLGKQVFDFPIEPLSLLRQYLTGLYGTAKDSISYDEGRQIIYRMFIEREFPFLSNRYLDQQYATLLENEIKQHVFEKFKDYLTPGDFTKDQEKIYTLLKYLSTQGTYTAQGGSGLRFELLSTNYDFNLEYALDLREDSHLIYRGFTPICIDGVKDYTFHSANSPMISLLKLNGGFEIMESENGFVVETRIDELSKKYKDYELGKSIILPSAQQDYQSEYFQMIFPKAIDVLKRSDLLVFVGTSLPEEDVLFTQMLSHFAEQTADYHQKQIVFITKCDEAEIADYVKKILNIFPQYERIRGHIHVYTRGLLQFIEDLRAEYIENKHPLEGLPYYWTERCWEECPEAEVPTYV